MTLLAYTAVFIVFMVIFTREVIAPASQSRCDRRWLILASAVNALQMFASLLAGHLFSVWFEGHSLMHLRESVSAPVGGALTFLLASFIAYWWHRAAHASDFLWRIFHQLHHSPNRIEALTAFYAHPFDAIAATLISCVCAYLVFGLGTGAAAWALLYVGIFNLYIHSDTAAPRWLGVLIQRPEMHRVHHEYGSHARNYGLPLWDLLFGTWTNPHHPVLRCGFDEDKSGRVHEMLLGRDVHRDDKMARSDEASA